MNKTRNYRERKQESVSMNILHVIFDTKEMYEKAKTHFDSDGPSPFWAGDWNDETRTIEFAEANSVDTLEVALTADMESAGIEGYHFELADTMELEPEEEHGKHIELDYDAGDVVTWHCDDDGQDHTSTITGITIEVNSEGEAEVTYKTEIEFKGRKQDAYFSEYDIVNK